MPLKSLEPMCSCTRQIMRAAKGASLPATFAGIKRRLPKPGSISDTPKYSMAIAAPAGGHTGRPCGWPHPGECSLR